MHCKGRHCFSFGKINAHYLLNKNRLPWQISGTHDFNKWYLRRLYDNKYRFAFAITKVSILSHSAKYTSHKNKQKNRLSSQTSGVNQLNWIVLWKVSAAKVNIVFDWAKIDTHYFLYAQKNSAYLHRRAEIDLTLKNNYSYQDNSILDIESSFWLQR